MENHLLFCLNCETPLPESQWNTQKFEVCDNCHSEIQIDVFPSIFKPAEKGELGQESSNDEAECFYHPQKEATVICSVCGRFLCTLCDLDIDGAHICPSCLEKGEEKGSFESLENHFVRHDSLALALSFLSMLTIYFTLLLAPISIFWALKTWNRPKSIFPRTKVRAILTILFSILQIIGWIFFIILIIVALTKK